MAVCGLHIRTLDQDRPPRSQSRLDRFGPAESQSSEDESKEATRIKELWETAFSGRNYHTPIVLIVLGGLLVIGLKLELISLAGVYKTVVEVLIGIVLNRIV